MERKSNKRVVVPILAVLLIGWWSTGCYRVGMVETEDTESQTGDADADADGDADGDADADADGDADADADGDADADADGDSDSDADGDADADADGDSDSDADGDADSDADGDSDSDADGDADSDADGDADADADGDADSDADGDADTLGNWFCVPSYFGTQDGCDCECGAWDPDCDVAGQSVFGCNTGEICVDPGVCALKLVPAEWNCDPRYYFSDDGCDCECGLWDPDCDGYGEMHNCRRDELCILPGVCAPKPELPVEWICSPSFFATMDGCDCGCGAWDPDCELASQAILNCQGGELCVEPGVCSTPVVD